MVCDSITKRFLEDQIFWAFFMMFNKLHICQSNNVLKITRALNLKLKQSNVLKAFMVNRHSNSLVFWQPYCTVNSCLNVRKRLLWKMYKTKFRGSFKNPTTVLHICWVSKKTFFFYVIPRNPTCLPKHTNFFLNKLKTKLC